MKLLKLCCLVSLFSLIVVSNNGWAKKQKLQNIAKQIAKYQDKQDDYFNRVFKLQKSLESLQGQIGILNENSQKAFLGYQFKYAKDNINNPFEVAKANYNDSLTTCQQTPYATRSKCMTNNRKLFEKYFTTLKEKVIFKISILFNSVKRKANKKSLLKMIKEIERSHKAFDTYAYREEQYRNSVITFENKKYAKCLVEKIGKSLNHIVRLYNKGCERGTLIEQIFIEKKNPLEKIKIVSKFSKIFAFSQKINLLDKDSENYLETYLNSLKSSEVNHQCSFWMNKYNQLSRSVDNNEKPFSKAFLEVFKSVNFKKVKCKKSCTIITNRNNRGYSVKNDLETILSCFAADDHLNPQQKCEENLASEVDLLRKKIATINASIIVSRSCKRIHTDSDLKRFDLKIKSKKALKHFIDNLVN